MLLRADMAAMFLIFLASLWISLRRTIVDGKALIEELFIAGCVSTLCALLPEFLMKPFLGIYLLFLAIDELLHRRLGIRLRPELFSHFLQPSIYWSSVANMRKEFGFTLFYLLTTGSALWFVSGSFSVWAFFLIPLGWIFSPKDHFLCLGALDLFKAPKRQTPRKAYSFQSEDAVFLSPDYPLLRITRKFLGDKQFSIDLGKKRAPHVIFFFLESFRSKNVGCLGANDGLTPHFDALSRDGVLFSNFYSNSNCTSWSTIASLFGVPASMARSYLRYYVDLPMIGLPEIMQEKGYHSAVIQGAHLMFQGTHEFYQRHGFQTIIGKREIEQAMPHIASTSWGVHDEGLVSYGIDFLKKQPGPVFLNLFSITNHHPWMPPPGESRHPIPYYNTFAYTDWALGEWVRRLKEEDLWKDTILFVLGDHGQAFGEHDPHFGSHRTLYEEDVQVPLLILAPGRLEKPVRIDDPCSQIDLLPTILDLFGWKSPHHSLGQSLIRKKKRFVYCHYPFDDGAIACRMGAWKGIIKGQMEQLFDLKRDPGEQKNVARDQPHRWRRLKKMLRDYRDELQALYENCALAPRAAITGGGHFAPPKEIDDDALASEIALRRPLFSLDLSNCTNIIGKSIADHDLLSLNASHCIRFMNPLMAPLMRSCPKLLTLDLSHCSLLTDAGVAALLQNSQLEELNLQGLDELCEIPPLPPARFLRSLNLSECPRLDGASWSSWLASLPSLKELRLCCALWTSDHLDRLSGNLHSLSRLSLSDGLFLSSEAVAVLIAANPTLVNLTLENCPQIVDALIASLQKHSLRSISLINCPRITDEALTALKGHPLQWMKIQNCPGIREEGLIALQNEGVEIYVS